MVYRRLRATERSPILRWAQGGDSCGTTTVKRPSSASPSGENDSSTQASELFGERGYAATSIRSVLQQSGLRDRYFGESFADLDSLLAAVYARLIDEEIAACAAAIDKTSGGAEGARAMIDTLTRSFEKNPGQARIKSREVLSGDRLPTSNGELGFTGSPSWSPASCHRLRL